MNKDNRLIELFKKYLENESRLWDFKDFLEKNNFNTDDF